jgi:chromosome partitioning protein
MATPAATPVPARRTKGGAKIVSFINYKGGVGKTTTTYHVGCALAQFHKKRVLLVDIDPQTNLTFLCTPYERWLERKRKQGTIARMYKRFLDKLDPEPAKHVWQAPVGALKTMDLIPCDIDLLGEDLGAGAVSGTHTTMAALKANAQQFLRDRRFLRDAFRPLQTRYDYILIDCPPNLYLMTQNALLASDWYVVTAIPDHLSTIGLKILEDKVIKIGEHVGAALKFAGEPDAALPVAQRGGIIFVKVRIGGSRLTRTHSAKMAEVKSLVGAGVCFSTHTTELIGYGEASEYCLPVWLHNSENAHRAAANGEYQRITEEFLSRFDA